MQNFIPVFHEHATVNYPEPAKPSQQIIQFINPREFYAQD